MALQRRGQPGLPALGGFPADAGVDESDIDPLLLPAGGQQGRPALFGGKLITGTQAVAIDQQGGSMAANRTEDAQGAEDPKHGRTFDDSGTEREPAGHVGG